ncbi:hypothetical protein EDD99_7818 [Streptomyces sp. 846.5]|nr:hypothetical protein EDD99_7818 [Streptomyces sp. 846.5]
MLSRAKGGYRDVFRRYRVIIDDTQVGLIGRGQTLRFDVPAGAHQLQLKIDWCSSAPLTAVVEAGEAVCFVCAPGDEMSEALNSVTAAKNDYIILQPTTEPPDVVSTPQSRAARFRLATAFGFFGGCLTLIGAWIWHFTGVAPGADNTVGLVSLLVTLACMIAFRTGGPGKDGQRRHE